MSGSSGECNSPARLSRTEAELYLLSLDGGGVRGLSSLLVLKQIMEAIDPTHPPKPCDYFDMIGGTSTGGLIAIMLGRMRLSVDECIHAYSELAPEAFAKVHHRIKLRNGDTQGRFDHSALREGIRSLLKTHGMDPESLLETKEDNSCKVSVAFTSLSYCYASIYHLVADNFSLNQICLRYKSASWPSRRVLDVSQYQTGK